MKSRYTKLYRRMLTISLLVSLVPLNVLGLGIYQYFAGVNQDKIKEELRRRAESRAQAIELFLAERTSLLEVLALNSNLEDLSDKGKLTSLLQVLNSRQRSFLDLGVIDSSGEQLAYVGPYALEGQNYHEAAWFQQVMARGVYISDVFLGVRELPHFVIAVANIAENRPWVLRATIDSEVFNDLVRSGHVGQSGDAYLVNSQGMLQTPSRFDGRILEQASFDVRTVPRVNSVSERVTPEGQHVFTAFSWLPRHDWLLVVDQNPDELLGPLHLAKNVEILILVLASLLIVTSVVVMVRILVRRLEQHDRERASLDAQLAHSARLVSLGRMAAGVAHEVNNPLASIGELAGEIDDILRPEALAAIPEGELCRENLDKIQQQVSRARDVTHRMLKFARRMEPQLDPLDVNEALRETHSFVAKDALFQNITVELDLAEGLPSILADRSQLQQVFLNLLNNALDAVGPGGQVWITSRDVDDSLEVRVSDNGPGIPKDVGDRIFDPFFTTKDPGQGTGLGLSISHGIMERLGGQLTFESEPGHGATFIVRIPKVLPGDG